MTSMGRLTAISSVVLALIMPAVATAQAVAPPPAPQNPSPMVEHTRVHSRIPQYEPAGIRRAFAGPLGKEVRVFVPAASRHARAVNLLIHFHGAPYLAEHAVSQVGKHYVCASLQLGSGNGIYDSALSDPAVFDSLLADIHHAVADALGRPVEIRSLALSGFSAGHGAIRAILRDSRHYDAVNSVLLLDGLHTDYVPAATVVAVGGQVNPAKLTEFLKFAKAAAEGRKRMLITHSEIFPGTFASTTETTDLLLDSLGLKRKSVLKWGPLGMQQTSGARRGRFEILGFAGNAGPDHIDHFHGMYEFLARLERL